MNQTKSHQKRIEYLREIYRTLLMAKPVRTPWTIPEWENNVGIIEREIGEELK